MDLTHLSLFSGIGGLDLAAEWAGFETVGQCEWADYPTKVLEKNWPDVPRWRNISTLTGESFYEQTGLHTVDVISGGFPCQPHSTAGNRRASCDERDLSGEFLRIVRELAPRFVVAENVRGILYSENGKFFRGFLSQLVEIGYRVGWICIPASLAGAIFERDRVFVLAIRTNCINDCAVKKAEAFQPETYASGSHGAVLREEREIATGAGCKRNIPANRQFVGCESGVDRAAHGVPHRVDRVRCLGNAVIPQQAYPIFSVVADIAREAAQ